MEIFILIAVFCLLIGAVLGWFAKPSLFGVILWCFVVSLILGGILLYCGSSESLTPTYILTSAMYFVFPFFFFFLIPTITGGILANWCARRKTRMGGKK